MSSPEDSGLDPAAENGGDRFSQPISIEDFPPEVRDKALAAAQADMALEQDLDLRRRTEEKLGIASPEEVDPREARLAAALRDALEEVRAAAEELTELHERVDHLENGELTPTEEAQAEAQRQSLISKLLARINPNFEERASALVAEGSAFGFGDDTLKGLRANLAVLREFNRNNAIRRVPEDVMKAADEEYRQELVNQISKYILEQEGLTPEKRLELAAQLRVGDLEHIQELEKAAASRGKSPNRWLRTHPKLRIVIGVGLFAGGAAATLTGIGGVAAAAGVARFGWRAISAYHASQGVQEKLGDRKDRREDSHRRAPSEIRSTATNIEGLSDGQQATRLVNLLASQSRPEHMAIPSNVREAQEEAVLNLEDGATNFIVSHLDEATEELYNYDLSDPVHLAAAETMVAQQLADRFAATIDKADHARLESDRGVRQKRALRSAATALVLATAPWILRKAFEHSDHATSVAQHHNGKGGVKPGTKVRPSGAHAGSHPGVHDHHAEQSRVVTDTVHEGDTVWARFGTHVAAEYDRLHGHGSWTHLSASDQNARIAFGVDQMYAHPDRYVPSGNLDLINPGQHIHFERSLIHAAANHGIEHHEAATSGHLTYHAAELHDKGSLTPSAHHAMPDQATHAYNSTGGAEAPLQGQVDTTGAPHHAGGTPSLQGYADGGTGPHGGTEPALQGQVDNGPSLHGGGESGLQGSVDAANQTLTGNNVIRTVSHGGGLKSLLETHIGNEYNRTHGADTWSAISQTAKDNKVGYVYNAIKQNPARYISGLSGNVDSVPSGTTLNIARHIIEAGAQRS